MRNRFLQWGYSKGSVNRAINIARKTERSHLLGGKTCDVKKQGPPVFSTPFSMEFRKIKNIVEHHLPIL